MTSLTFGTDKAISFLGSDSEYPVDFDYAWKVCGYSRKSDALKTLKSVFLVDADFCGLSRKNAQRGRPSVCYALTVDCFKHFGMMAQTKEGRNIRQYFIEAEKQLKQQASLAVAEPVTTQLSLADTVRQDYSAEVTQDMRGQYRISVAAYERLINLGHSTLQRGLASHTHALHKKLIAAGWGTSEIKSWLTHKVPEEAFLTITRHYASATLKHDEATNRAAELLAMLDSYSIRGFFDYVSGKDVIQQELADLRQKAGQLSAINEVFAAYPGFTAFTASALCNQALALPSGDKLTAAGWASMLCKQLMASNRAYRFFCNALNKNYCFAKKVSEPDKVNGVCVYPLSDKAIVEQSLRVTLDRYQIN